MNYTVDTNINASEYELSVSDERATARDGAIFGTQWWHNRPEPRKDTGLVYTPITRRKKFEAPRKGEFKPQNIPRTRVFIYQNLVQFQASAPDQSDPETDKAKRSFMERRAKSVVMQKRVNDEKYLFATIRPTNRLLALTGNINAISDMCDLQPRINEAPKRGRITSFSRSSRARLLKKVNKASFIKNGGYFVTLTYPREYSIDFRIWKKHLDNFLNRVRRLCKRNGYDLRYLWKLEFQQRGAPHFHMMFFGIPEHIHAEFMQWVSNSWYEVVNSGDTKHLDAGTNVRWMDNGAMVGFYVGKYLSKLEEIVPEYTGRFWGTCSVWEMEVYVLLLKNWQFIKLRRLISRHLKGKGAERYAKRIKTMRSFFVAGIGFDSQLLLHGLANTSRI